MNEDSKSVSAKAFLKRGIRMSLRLTPNAQRKNRLVIRMNGEVIDPAPVALVTDHARCDHGPIQPTDQEPLRSDGEFSGDVLAGIIVGNDQAAGLPESEHGRLVGG